MIGPTIASFNIESKHFKRMDSFKTFSDRLLYIIRNKLGGNFTKELSHQNQPQRKKWIWDDK